jgi:predicted DNA-binding protein (UPF0251 family)
MPVMRDVWQLRLLDRWRSGGVVVPIDLNPLPRDFTRVPPGAHPPWLPLGDLGPVESPARQLRDKDIVPAASPYLTLRETFGPRLTAYAWDACDSRSFTPDDRKQAISAALEWAADKDLSRKPGSYVAKGLRNAVWETVRKAGPGHFLRLRTAEGRREWEEQLHVAPIGRGDDSRNEIMAALDDAFDHDLTPHRLRRYTDTVELGNGPLVRQDDPRRFVIESGLSIVAQDNPVGAEAARLHYMHGMTWDEVADELNITKRTAIRKGMAAFGWIAGQLTEHATIAHQMRPLRKDPNDGGSGRGARHYSGDERSIVAGIGTDDYRRTQH